MTTATGTDTSPAPALPTHAQGLALFQAVIDTLQLAGWERHRIDTFRHPSNADQLRSGMTVRHHFDHGWELFYERDRYFNRDARPTNTVVIRLDRPLPEVATVINQLFGAHVGRYFPMTSAEVEAAITASATKKNGHRRPSKPLARPKAAE